MPKTIIFLIIGLFFGTGIGFLVAATSGAQLEGHEHGSAVHDHSAHDHGGHEGMDHSKMTDVSDKPPTLSVVLHPDGPQSRNLEIVTTNFEFDPVGVNGEHEPGKGHAHVYINDVKITRAYAPWLQLSALPKGEHTLRVTLNANDHSHLAVNGEPLEVIKSFVIE